MTKNGKNRKISAAAVLMPLMLIFAVFMVTGCDWLLGEDEDGTKALKDAIAEAKSLLANTKTSDVDGSDVSHGEYWATSGNKAALQTAITTAEGVFNADATQEEIDAALTALKAAINTFKSQRKLKEAAGSKIGNTLTITDIQEAYFEHRINVFLISSTNDLYSEVLPPVSGYYGNVDNSSITLELFSSITEEPWTGTGSYYVYVSLSSQDYENIFSYVSKNKVTFGTNPSINFSTGFNVFNWGEGKTITITNLPDIYFDNKFNVYLFQSNTNILINDYFSSAYGYGEVDSLLKKLELFSPSSDDPWTETGSYYVVVSFEYFTYSFDYYISRNKVNCEANPADMNFKTDFVKYNDFTPTATVPLVENIWASGNLSYSEPIKWYSFSVQNDTDYEIFINDYDWDTSKADVVIEIYLNGVKIRDELDIGYFDTGEFIASESGTVHVRVYPYGPESFSDIIDSFDIGYSTSRDRDDLEWPH